MIAWLHIAGESVRQFFSSPAALAFMDVAQPQHAFLSSLGTIREDSEGETPNATATLTKDALPLFDDPPIGARAFYKSDDGDQFDGVIKTISVSVDGVSLGIEQ